MSDLTVDLALLASAAGSLAMLIEEFSNAGTIAGQESGDVGQPHLQQAVHDFANNWTVHRGQLLDSMNAVYKMATSSHDAFISEDDQLAQDIMKAMSASSERVGGGR